MKKQKNIALIFCSSIFLIHFALNSPKEMDLFYSIVTKGTEYKKALDMLNKDGNLVNASYDFSPNSVLENALDNFNKDDLKAIKNNSDQTQFLERLFYYSLYQNKLNPLKGASFEDIMNAITRRVKSKNKKKIVTDLLVWAHDLTNKQNIKPEEVTNKLFFESIRKADPKVLRLIRINPFWLEEKSSNGLNPLQAILKNYSGETREDELITTIIILKPDLLFPENNNDESIRRIISGHNSYVRYLNELIAKAIEKVENFPPEGNKSSEETKEFYLNSYRKKDKNGKKKQLVSKN